MQDAGPVLSLLGRKFCVLGAMGMVVVGLTGCAGFSRGPTVEQPSLDVKIGQMLMVGFRGLKVDKRSMIVEDIRDRYLGAVVLYDYDMVDQKPQRNIESFAQVRKLVSALQAVSPIPLLIAIDQEGGRVCRLKESYGFAPTVSAGYLGGVNNLALTHKHAAEMARTLGQLGINLNLAPVVDLNVNPDNPIIGRLERSFSADPDIVTAHALEFIKAHRQEGVLCAVKHFPGHGSSAADSHLGMVDVTATWSQVELEPYAKIIEQGQADAVVTAHVFNARLDPQYPATLSEPTITGILREQLNYRGVIISDDMQMGAIAEHYGLETAVRAAIQGGCDIILISNNLAYEENIVAQVVAVIKKLVQDGQISEQRIDKSYQRIRQLKSKITVPKATGCT